MRIWLSLKVTRLRDRCRYGCPSASEPRIVLVEALLRVSRLYCWTKIHFAYFVFYAHREEKYSSSSLSSFSKKFTNYYSISYNRQCIRLNERCDQVFFGVCYNLIKQKWKIKIYLIKNLSENEVKKAKNITNAFKQRIVYVKKGEGRKRILQRCTTTSSIQVFG